MVTKLEQFLSWLALPLYAYQGLAVRRAVPRMGPPEPQVFAEFEGEGDPIRLLMIGDSSIAGVGVKDFRDCVAGTTPRRLAALTGRPVTCRTNGNNSATAGNLRDYALPNLKRESYDYVVISIGVNDAKNFHTGRRFCKEFGTLIYGIKARFPDAKIIWSGIIDLGGVPVLPSPLNKILSIRSRILQRNGKELCFERGVLSPETEWNPVPENFSEDKFHCSEQGYKVWAEELARFIASQETA